MKVHDKNSSPVALVKASTDALDDKQLALHIGRCSIVFSFAIHLQAYRREYCHFRIHLNIFMRRYRSTIWHLIILQWTKGWKSSGDCFVSQDKTVKLQSYKVFHIQTTV